MTAKERLIELQESKSEYRAKGGQGLLSLLSADSPLRREVRYLTKVYLHRTLTGCSSCAMDAYFELLNIKPTDIDMEKLYELKAVDDHLVEFGVCETLTPDELRVGVSAGLARARGRDDFENLLRVVVRGLPTLYPILLVFGDCERS